MMFVISSLKYMIDFKTYGLAFSYPLKTKLWKTSIRFAGFDGANSHVTSLFP